MSDPVAIMVNGRINRIIASATLAGDRERPGSSQDHSHTGTVRNAPVPLTLLRTRPVSACDESPLVAR